MTLRFRNAKIEKPSRDMYIISDDNHIGWFIAGFVYYFEVLESGGVQGKKSELSEWCNFWMPLLEVYEKGEAEFKAAVDELY